MFKELRVLASEYQARIDSLRSQMAAKSVDVFVISDRENFEYFSGYKSLFWASKARPFFLLVPKAGDTTVVIAAAAEAKAFSQTNNLPPSLVHRPYSGFMEHCTGAIIDTLEQYKPARIAFDYGFENFALGSISLIESIKARFPATSLVEGAQYIWPIRLIKSGVEIAQKREALKIATDAFHASLKTLKIGTTENEFAKILTLSLIERGASSVPWLPVRFGQGNFAYSLPPTDRPLASGDFIWVDIGCVFLSSISDVNRIAKAGPVSAQEQRIYSQVREMTISTLAAMRPGMSGADLFGVFGDLASESDLGLPSSTASRIGHGSGLNLTEPPSISAQSDEVLEEGMIIHIEPKYEIDGGVYQVEEVAVVTKNGSEFISCHSEESLPSVL